MSFQFGAGNNNTAPAPAPGGGFTFGGASGTPAPSAPAPSFSFGSAPVAAPVAAPAPGGFSFGVATPAAAPTTGTTPAAPAPAAPAPTGFSFGNTPAPAPTTTTTAPAAPGGFSFGSTTTTPAPAPNSNAPAPSTSVSFGGTNTPAPATAPGITTPPQPQATLQTKDFDTVYPNMNLWQQIQKWSTDESSILAGQELLHSIATNQQVLKPKAIQWTPPNPGLRQQMTTNPTVSLTNSDSTFTTTTLIPKTMERIFQLASDLRISEANAVSLYAHVSQYTEAISSLSLTPLTEKIMSPSLPGSKKYSEISKLARDFYFYQEGLQLHTLLHLLQLRVQNPKAVIEGTDILLQAGLVTDLVQVVRDYAQRIQQLQQELESTKANMQVHQMTQHFQQQSLQGPSTVSKSPPNFANVHLIYCQQQTQVAAECLFFIAYHTQLTSSEMAALLDLIKDLSSGLPILNPFTNVPSPYESAEPTSAWPSNSNTPFTFALKEKDPLMWQRELVLETYQSGQPQRLQSISLLIVTAISALETRQVLYDRQRHGPNEFGRGNQFLPPGNPTGVPQEIQSRLQASAASQWQRKDIWGVLAAAYAILLRSAPSLMQSPRAGASVSSQQNDMRNTARECFFMPSTFKSFTFCRLTLVPALQRLSVTAFANVSEFGLAVLSEFYSHYLNILSEGSLPMSRQKYEKEEREELNLRRAQQAQQASFNSWSGNTNTSQEVIPTSVDLMARPDCMDDIVAFASTLCNLGSEYAQHFWERDADGGLLPSRILSRLERSQASDDSLTPSYLSFLAALSNDEASATAVYNILSPATEATFDNSANLMKISCSTLIFNLRWYAQELSSFDANTISKPTKTTTSTNTSYYYNLEGNAMPSNASNTASSKSNKASSSSSSKSKELSELARYRVTSHLAVLQSIAKHSPLAQQGILSITLPVGDAIAAGGDDALLVLFKLAIAPLSPTVRGATLTTIATLLEILPDMSTEQKDFVQQQAKNAWEYLESCPLLPISLLDQYSNRNLADGQARIGLSFPPSSMTLSNSGPDGKSLLPKDQNYGLLYEMEHVESRMGWYPSSEGFLYLLRALVCAAGCPSKLGQSWRLRVGCAPYIEYVIDFVLPRVLGVCNAPALPFRVPGDQCRLVARALQVLEAVVVRYSVPIDELKVTPTEDIGKKALTLLGVESVVNDVIAPDASNPVEKKELVDDFRNLTVAPVQLSDQIATATSNTAPSASAGPLRTKSPGFMILADMLSAGGGVIFQSVAKVLADFGGTDGIKSIYGLQSEQMTLAYALFGATPPDTKSAKEGSKEGGPTKSMQTLLKPLSPLMDKTQFDDAASWREYSIILALRLFCAAAAQEDAFIAGVTGAKEVLKIVPVLRFQKIRYGSSNFRVIDVRLSKLTNLLFSIEKSQTIRSSIVDCIGYRGSDEEQISDLGSAALALLYYLYQTVPSHVGLTALCGNEPVNILARAVANRLLSSSKRPDSLTDIQTTNLIFNWMLRDLRAGTAGELVQALLGLPNSEKGGNWEPKSKQYAGMLIDCFDAILALLKDVDYTTSKTTSGTTSLCFEVIFRLYDLLQGGESDPTCLKIVLYTAERLRSADFWKTYVLVWLSERGAEPLKHATADEICDYDPNILNSIAWLLKGLAIEIKLLVGFANRSILDSGLGGMLAPRPERCKILLSLLLGPEERILLNLIHHLPLVRVSIDQTLVHPPIELLREASIGLPGPADVVSEYQIVDADILSRELKSRQNGDAFKSMIDWVDQWNAVAAWDCASSHISNATYMILSAGLYSSESLGSSQSIGEIVGLQADGLTNLLALILQRLDFDDSSEQHRGMDAILFPAATRNLSNAVLLLSERITAFRKQDAPIAADLITICSMLSRTLTYSSIGGEAAVELPTRYERTTVFASALSSLLRFISHAEPDFFRQYRNDFLVAANSLSKVCIFKVDTTSTDSRGIVSVLARSCFGSLLDACRDEDEEQMNESFVFCSLPSEFIGKVMKLVACMDVNICSLLQTIALQPFGAEILVDGGICDALQVAAKTYLAEEARVSAQLQGSSYNKVELTTPVFLLGHLKLLSSLMSSSSLPVKKSLDLSVHASETLVLYKTIIQRLCYNFPAEADVLRCFMRCLIQALSLSQSFAISDRHDLLAEHKNKLKEIFSRAGLVENGILMLSQQLWENPLPRDLLPQLPPELERRQKPGFDASVVSVEKESQRSWWDVLDGLLIAKGNNAVHTFDAPVGQSDFWGTNRSKGWDENKFEYGAVAMDTLSLALSLLKRLNYMESLDSASLARGLYICSFAAQTVGARHEEVSLLARNPSTQMETDDYRNVGLEAEYVSLLGTSISHCVEELMVMSYVLVGDSKENEGSSQLFCTALDNVAMESKGVGLLSSMHDGADRIKLVEHLCSKLKGS